MKLYGARSTRNREVEIVEYAGPCGTVVHDVTKRYVMSEASDIARWLNERAHGYPVPNTLRHLHNGH